MSRSDLVDVTMTLHIETANAIRVSDDGDKEKGVWLPKSQIEFTKPNAKQNHRSDDADMAREGKRTYLMAINFRSLGKCDQIAFYAHNEAQANAIKAMLGLLSAEWVTDRVMGDVTIWPSSTNPSKRAIPLHSQAQSVGLLQFNYDLGIEIEILTYLHGPNWHCEFSQDYAGGAPFLSHIGFHLPDEGEMPYQLGGEAPLVQEMFTRSHTNDYVVMRGRKYHYRIFDTRATNGVFTKLIRRIRGQKELAELALQKAAETPTKDKEPKKFINGGDILEAAAATFRERNKVYGDNYLRIGEMMRGMFPDGLTVKTAHDWNRLHILLLGIIKLSRYAVNWDEGGHQDSIHDNTVYSAILEAIDTNGER